MTNKFRITKKKDGTVSYHMEGSSDFINSISDKILNSKKASKTDLMKLCKPSEQHKPTDHHINMPATIKPTPPKNKYLSLNQKAKQCIQKANLILWLKH